LEFGVIPYVHCRIYDGFPNKANKTYLDIDYSKMDDFKNATGVIIARLDVSNTHKELISQNLLLFDSDLFEIEKFIKKRILIDKLCTTSATNYLYLFNIKFYQTSFLFFLRK